MQRSLALLVLLLVTGCSQSSYLLRQGWRQLRVLRARQPLEVVLRRPDLPPAWREKLEVARLARLYAQEVIGLSRTAAYTVFLDTGGQPLAWNLSACPKDSLRPKTWRFPLVGEIPYLGFLKEEEGRRVQRRLDGEGLDTELRPVNAWSSLGWFADPITSSMLDEDVSRLVEVIIHEITHSTVFLRGQVAFNESLAVFVGDQGAVNFLSQLYGPLSPEVQRMQASVARRGRFTALIEELVDKLQLLYEGPLPPSEKLRRREEEFAEAQRRYRELFPEQARSRFARQPLNNAVLLGYGRYNRGLRFHRLVYQRLGRDLARLVAVYREAQRYPDPIQQVARRFGLPPLLPQRH